ncbi:tRNA (adenine-N(1)-)-methyltransferase catalytic subunit trm61 [Xanthoria calcicola]
MSTTSPFLQPSSAACPDALAILHLKRDLLTPTVLRTYDDEQLGYAEGKVTTTRYGNYPHSTLIGQPWGSQIRASLVDTGTRGRVGLHLGSGKKRKRQPSSRSQRDGSPPVERAIEPGPEHTRSPELKSTKPPIPAPTGFCHILPPTPEIWTASLPHRTQVVYTPDYSYILQRLRVTPGTTLIEAGAGSGSFTHAAARAVFNDYPRDATTLTHDQSTQKLPTAPSRTGRVWSFDFHEQRIQKLAAEIQEHGLEGVVTATHRDVYQDGFALDGPSSNPTINASAVFLDLPAPWMALRHLTRHPLSPLNPLVSVHLCTFSPCIEQVQRTVSVLRSLGWLEIEMVELSSHRIEVRRERVGLQEEGLRGVNASPATLEEALGRLREVEGRDRSYHHGMTSQTRGEDLADEATGEYVSKQQRLQHIRDAQADRKLYNEGRLVHRSEPELKTHTSYLVFAILPRAWTDDDERKAHEWLGAGPVKESNGANQPKSKRQMKREAKEQAGSSKDVEMDDE